MTYRMVLKRIRSFVKREDDTIEETFKTIVENRGCHPVRYWSIYDIAKRENLTFERAERLYYRHLARLHEIFSVSQVGY